MPVRGGISLPHTFPWRLLSERRNHPIRTPAFLLPGLKCLSWVTRKFQRGKDWGPGAPWGQARAAWLCLAQPHCFLPPCQVLWATGLGQGHWAKLAKLCPEHCFRAPGQARILHSSVISKKVQRRLGRSLQARESCFLWQEGHLGGLQHTVALSTLKGRAVFPATG